LAAKSGCGLLYIGVESISTPNLRGFGKSFFKAEEISSLIARIQKQGILIRASIIFGMDHDDPDVFHNTVDFLVREGVAYAEFFILTPMPGTELRRKLEEENRIIDYDWSHYDCLRAVFRPLGMGKETLEKGLWDAYKEFYSTPNILRRCFKLASQNRRLRTVISNFYYQRMVLKTRHPIYG
jgi:radical SAM superfamily enzyme YgiQ (UPF0313 family)